MTNKDITRLTGFVMPVGNGAVGKTSVARLLEFVSAGREVEENLMLGIEKSLNLEFEFITSHQVFGDKTYDITMQFLVPPGQKENEGGPAERSFEKVIEIFKSMIKRIDVVLFTYDLSNIETFRDLDYWLHAVSGLLNDASHFILLGTHLDRDAELEINKNEIEDGLNYLEQELLEIYPNWIGKSSHLEVSNLTGENLQKLLKFIAGSIINSRKILP